MISPYTFCREDIPDENPLCFLEDNLYAHTTKIENVPSILKEGIKVMERENRVHQHFDTILRQECQKRDVYDLACQAREGSTFFFSDFHGAIDHSLYMGTLKKIVFEEPAIIIATLDPNKVSLDPENNRYEDDLKNIEKRINENWEDSLPVQHVGNVPPNRIKYICTLTDNVKDSMKTNIDFDSFDPYELKGEKARIYFETLYNTLHDEEEYIKEEYELDFTLPTCEDEDVECYMSSVEIFHDVLNEHDDIDALHNMYYEFENEALTQVSQTKSSFSEYYQSLIVQKDGRITDTMDGYYEFDDKIMDFDNWKCQKHDVK